MESAAGFKHKRLKPRCVCVCVCVVGSPCLFHLLLGERWHLCAMCVMWVCVFVYIAWVAGGRGGTARGGQTQQVKEEEEEETEEEVVV